MPQDTFIYVLLFFLYWLYFSKIEDIGQKIKMIKRKKYDNDSTLTIIKSFIGSNCKVKFNDINSNSLEEVECLILDVDDEWLKLSYIGVKDNNITKKIRIDSILTIEEMKTKQLYLY